MLTRLSLLTAALIVMAGCAGSNSSVTPSAFAGSYTGTWVNTTDATDAGTSLWSVDSEGRVDGQDFDPVRGTTFHVVGRIDAAGHLISNSTPTTGSSATLNGDLAFNAQSKLTGQLVWGVVPPLTYTYTFTRK